MNSFFQRLEALLGIENLEKLKNSSVAVVGLGGIGGMATISLARSGIGTIIIQDFDIVCESNFNRQIIANVDTIGKKKVDVMEEMILKINPNCNVIKLDEKFNSSSRLFEYKFDYLIDAIDSVDDKILLIESCLNKKIDFISSMGTAKKVDIKKLSITKINQTACDPLAKVVRRKLRDKNISDNFMVLSSNEEPKKTTILGSYMPVTASAGLMISDYIIKMIIEKN